MRTFCVFARAWRHLLLAIACALAVFFGLRSLARHLLFHGWGRPAAALAEGTRVELTSADGATVHALELPLAGAPVVVHFHDNTQTVADALDFARALRARGLAVVLVEYRGYGESAEATPSERALYDDAEAVLAWLARRGFSRERIVLSGRSLGTGVAAEMARRARGAALVLVAPFTSIPDLVTESAPFVPASLLVEDRFATGEKTAEIAVPTLVIHGDQDEVVPFHHGVTLARAIDRAALLRVAGARHGDVLERDPARVLESFAFFARTAAARPLHDP